MRIALGIMLSLLASLSTTASASNLAVIKIETENVTFVNHTSDLQGNWIVLSGGTEIRIPEITFNYSGPSSINYTKNSKNITITSPQNYEVKYPFIYHRMYSNNSNVYATFYGSSDLSGSVDIYLTKTSPTQIRNIASSMIDGITQPFKDLLNDAFYKESQNLSGSSIAVNWTLGAGDYVAVVMLNESNLNNLTIVSATTFQVLEYDLAASAPDSVQQGDNLDTSLSLNASGTFTYGGFLVHNDSYKATLKLRTNGTKPGTNLSADGEFLIDAFNIAGIGLDNVNTSTVQNIVEGIIGANNGTVVYKTNASNSTTLSLTTEDLRSGKYVLSIGAWSNKTGERLVAFYQKEVEVTQPSTQSSSSGGGGGSGGGGTTGERFDRILSKETRDGYVRKDALISYRFVTPPIIFVNFTSTINAGDISVVVEVLKNCSCLVQASPPGEVYKNINIWVGTYGFAVKEHISQASVTFEVNKTWIIPNDIDPSSIRLMQHKGNWTSLTTRKIGEDGKVDYYIANAEAFSPFAIVGEKKASILEKPSANVSQVVEIIKEVVAPAAAFVPVTWLGTFRTIPGPRIAYVVFALFLVLYLFRRMRRYL